MPPPDPLSQIFQHIRHDQLDDALQLLKDGRLTNRQKRLVNEYTQKNYYLASKTILLSIKNETNQSVIDTELSRLETAFLNRTQPSFRPTNGRAQ